LPKDTITITRIKIEEKGRELTFCSLECYNNYKKEDKQKLNKPSSNLPLSIGFLSLLIITILPVIYLLAKKRKK